VSEEVWNAFIAWEKSKTTQTHKTDQLAALLSDTLQIRLSYVSGRKQGQQTDRLPNANWLNPIKTCLG
jgi:hypothetical protein